MAEAIKKARTIVVNYLDKDGAYTSDESGEFITFKVAGKLNKEFKLYPELMSDEVKKRAMFHGFNQKVRDAAAGKDKSEQDQYDAMLGVWQVLMDGAWDKAREPSMVSDERIAKCILRVRPGLTEAQATAMVAKAKPEEKKALIAGPKFAAELAKMKFEELEAKVTDDGDALLDSLLGEDESDEEEEQS
jgi:hypothetical protein